MHYIVRNEKLYVTLEPTVDYELDRALDADLFCICFAWTEDKGDAVRFASKWHAKAIARMLTKYGHRSVVIRVAA